MRKILSRWQGPVGPQQLVLILLVLLEVEEIIEELVRDEVKEAEEVMTEEKLLVDARVDEDSEDALLVATKEEDGSEEVAELNVLDSTSLELLETISLELEKTVLMAEKDDVVKVILSTKLLDDMSEEERSNTIDAEEELSDLLNVLDADIDEAKLEKSLVEVAWLTAVDDGSNELDNVLKELDAGAAYANDDDS
jgi:hypothetical protein